MASLVPARAEPEKKVYVAVGREPEQSRATLLWAAQTVSSGQKIVLAHVHCPGRLIPTNLDSGGPKLPAFMINKQNLRRYRLVERERLHKCLDDYLVMCSQLQVQPEQVVIQMDDVAKGLLDLIARFGITRLVMGAAADKHYSEKMVMPKSKTAISLKRRADPSCNIWFVCKGHLICTREVYLDVSGPLKPCMTSPSSNLTKYEHLKLIYSSHRQDKSPIRPFNNLQDLSRHESSSDNFDSYGSKTMAASTTSGPVKTSIVDERLSAEKSIHDPTEARRTYQNPHDSSWSANEVVLRNTGLLPIPEDKESLSENVMLSLVENSSEDLQFLTPDDEMANTKVNRNVYHQLQQALTVAENLKYEAYQESCKRRKAESNVVGAIQRARAADNFASEEIRQRKEIEGTLARGKLETEMLKNQLVVISEQLKMTNEQKLARDLRIADSNIINEDIGEKLSEVQYILDSFLMEHEALRQERDAAVKEADKLRCKAQVITRKHGVSYSEFSYFELQQATCGFTDSLKMGEWNDQTIYKGFLRNTIVTIKIMNPESERGWLEFSEELDVLSRARHPNLVTLIGACTEACALIYEFLPHGSLQDCLSCKKNISPLTWQVRCRIATEICSALIFLHSHSPRPLVHGNLGSDRVLLDANFMSKLSSIGFSGLLSQSNNTSVSNDALTNYDFGYSSPELLTTGELTPQSDIYSLGIIILHLLTGRLSSGINHEVKKALDEGYFNKMLDDSAGDWPFVHAKKLAYLGLRCSEPDAKNRLDLARVVWPRLEHIRKSATSMSKLSFKAVANDDSCIPNYFICPIFQEIMRDPHIAADGFTYEAEALNGWFGSGHDTSPMTNLKLRNCSLVPNHALRSAIQEWMQQQQMS